MSDFAITPGQISQLADVTTIELQSANADILATDRSVVALRLEADSILRFVAPESGTPVTNISLLQASFFVETTSSSSTPIKIEAQGVDIDITIPPDILPQVTVSDAGVGSGLPSGETAGTGAIDFAAVSPNWTPAALPLKIQDWWVADSADDFDETGDFIWLGKEGNLRWQWTGDGVEPAFSAVDQHVAFRQGGCSLQLADGTAASFDHAVRRLRFYVVIVRQLFSVDRFYLLTGSLDAVAVGRFNFGTPIVAYQTFVAGQSGNFNGEYDGTNFVAGSSIDYYPGAVDSAIPVETPFIFSLEGEPNTANDVNDIVDAFGQAGGISDRWLNGDVIGLAAFSDYLTVSEWQEVVRWGSFLLKDRGVSYDIDSSVPDYNVRPVVGTGGGSQGISLFLPPTTVTFSNIPEVGTDLYIYDAADNNELASLTSTLATHEIAYSANGSQIRVQIVFPAGTFLEINLTLAAGNIPIDVGAIAINERNFLNPS